MASSSSSKRCFASVEEKENSNIEGNEKIKAIVYDQQNIRSNIIEEFCKRNLEVPFLYDQYIIFIAKSKNLLLFIF